MRLFESSGELYWFILGTTLGLLAATLGALTIGLLSDAYLLMPPKADLVNNSVVPRCEGKDLEGTAQCLQSYVNTFYKYNESNLGRLLTLDELKSQGGVCTHWSRAYTELAGSLGYKTQEVTIYYNESGHRFAVLYTPQEYGYCIMEQSMRPYCVKLSDGGKV